MTTKTIDCVECGESVPYGRLSCPACGALLASVAGGPAGRSVRAGRGERGRLATSDQPAADAGEASPEVEVAPDQIAAAARCRGRARSPPSSAAERRPSGRSGRAMPRAAARPPSRGRCRRSRPSTSSSPRRSRCRPNRPTARARRAPHALRRRLSRSSSRARTSIASDVAADWAPVHAPSAYRPPMLALVGRGRPRGVGRTGSWPRRP